jgi:HAAS
VKRTGDDLVDQYLKRLRRELSDVPRARRRELVDEIAGHIEEARSGLEAENEAELRDVLVRLGDPAEIAAEERARSGLGRRRGGWVEYLALFGLLLGGFVFVVGWFVGLVLLWLSEAWTTAEKLVATLLVPGGLLPAFLILFGGLGGYTETCVSEGDPATGAQLGVVCTGGISLAARIFWIVLFVICVVGPFITTAFLATRMRQLAALGYEASPGSA